MENNIISNKTFDRRNFYNHDDSGKIFILTIFSTFILSFVATQIGGMIASATGFKGELTSNILFNVCYSVFYVGLIILLWLLYSSIKGVNPKAVGFRPKQKWHTYLIVALVGIAFLFGSQYIVSAFDNLLALCGYPMETGVGGVKIDGAGEYIYGIFILALVPAFCEELIFRGIIFRGLRERFSDGTSIIISALFFALMHQNLQQLIYPILFGSLLAWIVLKTGSLFLSMMVHFTNNLIVVTTNFIYNKTGFNFALPNTWWFYLVAVGCGAVTFAICFIVDKFYFKKKKYDEVEKSSSNTSKYLYIAIAVGVFMFLLNVVLYVISQNTAA